MWESELILIFKGLDKDNEIVVWSLSMSALEVFHELIPWYVFVGVVGVIVKEGLDFDSLEDASEADVSVVGRFKDSGEIKVGFDDGVGGESADIGDSFDDEVIVFVDWSEGGFEELDNLLGEHATWGDELELLLGFDSFHVFGFAEAVVEPDEGLFEG